MLERRAGIRAHGMDCFVNAVGGIRVMEPACDLGIALAIVSSVQNRIIDKGTVVTGEIGLGGEVRRVYGLESRLREAEKLGFKTAIVPGSSVVKSRTKMTVFAVNDVKSAVKTALEKN